MGVALIMVLNLNAVTLKQKPTTPDVSSRAAAVPDVAAATMRPGSPDATATSTSMGRLSTLLM